MKNKIVFYFKINNLNKLSNKFNKFKKNKYLKYLNNSINHGDWGLGLIPNLYFVNLKILEK